MAVEISQEILMAAHHSAFDRYRALLRKNRNDKVTAQVSFEELPPEALDVLETVAKEQKSRTLVRSLKVFKAARIGDFTHSIPTLAASVEVLLRYLRTDAIDGWIYVEDKAGNLSPELVTDISLKPAQYGRDDREYLRITTIRTTFDTGRDSKRRVHAQACLHTFSAEEVVNRTVTQVLENAGIQKETAELKAEYEAALERHVNEVMPAFAGQFRFTGKSIESSYSRKAVDVTDRKVINDMESSDYGPVVAYAHTPLVEEADDLEGDAVPENGLVPFHTVISVFDLKTYDFYWVDSRQVVPHVYDETLADKLVLPHTHRDLLDCLTQDLSLFAGDIVEGKGTGNVILCAGAPGIGKTLTAEVYAEIRKKPLYAIHSGNLGTTAKEVQEKLQVIFQRAKRWDCVLLLDEADVFVMARGRDLETNAVVAEFLRTLEYFDGLLFMTTNRHDDIDDAILSRCLAVIRYSPPERERARPIWKIVSTALGRTLEDGLVDELLDLFPKAAGRDMKQLCGTVFRMVHAGKWNLDADAFRRAAMFRGVDMNQNGGSGYVDGVEDPEIARLIRTAQDSIEDDMGFRPPAADALRYLARKSGLAA